MSNPIKETGNYIHNVRAEAKKITWPSRKETYASAIAVFIMVTIASIFLFSADQIISWGIKTLFGFFN